MITDAFGVPRTRVAKGSREVKVFLKMLDSKGIQAEARKSGHIKLTHPDHPGKSVFMPSTPSDHRALKNAHSQVKRTFPGVIEDVEKGLPSYLRKTPKALLSPGLARRVRLHEMGQTAAKGAARAKANPKEAKPYGWERPRQLPLFDRKGQKITPSKAARRKP